MLAYGQVTPGGMVATQKSPSRGLYEKVSLCILITGYDTSTAAISWALGLIAAHPDVQQKLAAELKSIGLKATPEQPQPRRLTWEDLSQMSYLRNIIKVGQKTPLSTCWSALLDPLQLAVAFHCLLVFRAALASPCDLCRESLLQKLLPQQ